MKTTHELTNEIMELTTMIQNKYPELYRHLDEAPVTIPNENDPDMNAEELTLYLEGMIQGLRKMIANHEETMNAYKAEKIKAPQGVDESTDTDFTI